MRTFCPVRAALRILAGILSVLTGMVAAIACIAITGGPDLAAMLIAAACLLGGFLGLTITRVAGAPLRPMRIALGFSIPPSAYMLTALPWPLTRAELGPFVVLALGLLLSASAMAVARHRPMIAVGMLVILAAYGVFMLGRFGRSLMSAASDWSHMGPATTISFILAASVGIAWIAALWHSRPIWRAFDWQHDLAT